MRLKILEGKADRFWPVLSPVDLVVIQVPADALAGDINRLVYNGATKGLTTVLYFGSHQLLHVADALREWDELAVVSFMADDTGGFFNPGLGAMIVREGAYHKKHSTLFPEAHMSTIIQDRVLDKGLIAINTFDPMSYAGPLGLSSTTIHPDRAECEKWAGVAGTPEVSHGIWNLTT